MIGVTENLSFIRDLLAFSAVEADREPQAVRLLAVSKRQAASSVIEAAIAGQLDFGENQLQEGLEKIASVANDQIIWHFIGHLQNNKTRPIAENFHWVHSVDRLKTAQRLSQHRPGNLGDLNVCLQVNVDAEDSKSGLPPAAVLEFAAAVVELPKLKLRGLMCLPAVRQDFEAQREPFSRLSRLADQLRASGLPADTLSMGMSGDYRAAIFEGSTMVRVGTAIFGPRAKA